MTGQPPTPDDRRHRLFRQMEWVFVVAPPIVAVAVAAVAGAFLAWFFPVAGTTFWGRWAAVSALLILVPAVAYGIRTLWERRRH